MDDTFDYVIVGAGAAGAILANRLTEDGKSTVCLLEAGPRDWHPFLHIPSGYIKVLFNPAFTWPLYTEPTEWTGGRKIPIPQGRTLGGSTSVNGLVYNRGQREDFDEWAALGNRGWSYAEVLPYFRRNEKRETGHATYRGRDGLLPVSDLTWRHPITEAFIAGAQQQGLPRNPDYNGETQAGVGYFQRSIAGRWRMSTARTYLRPAEKRPNLTIRTDARALAVVLEGKRATGVRYVVKDELGSARVVRARREVIVSAGALNTPKLLQLSGIGDPEHLKAIGVPVLHALPGVGRNLSDHFSVRLVMGVQGIATINEISRGPRLLGQIARWMLNRPNILAVSPSLVHFFWKSREDLVRPDLQGVFTPASYREGYVGMLDTYPGMTAGVWQHRPKSRGTVLAKTADPFADPVIQPRYLEHEEDRAALLGGMRLVRRLLNAPELSAFATKETLPGAAAQSDDDLMAFAKRIGVSSYHVNGTARMGAASEATAVVDDQLRVHGLQGLRIVDASVMPLIPSANTAAATMMIGEKAADLIRGKPPLPAVTGLSRAATPARATEPLATS